MTKTLFSDLTAQECELLNGGKRNGAGTEETVNTSGTASFVNDWHGLGEEHIDGGTDGDPENLHGTATLPNNKTLSPAG